MMKWLLTYLLVFSALLAYPQDAKHMIREGNKFYKEGNYDDAVAKYEEAKELDKNNYAVYLNKGDALYEKQKYKEAEQAFLNAISNGRNDREKAQAWHNLGNTYLQQKNYQESVKAYKESLKLNPGDEDTRYNLAYAMSKLQEQQNKNKQDQKNDKNQDKKQNKEDQQNKDQQKKDQQDKQDKKNDQQNKQQKKDQEKKNQEQQKQQQKEGEQKGDKKEQQQGQPEPMKLDKKQADRLLRALERKEQELQDKYQKRKFEVKSDGKTEKDW